MIATDTQDRKILGFLEKAPLHVSDLSRKLGIKRTSLAYRLNRLARLGLVQSNTVGRKSIYELKYKSNASKDHIQIYLGADMINAYKELLRLPKGAVILSIQGNSAAIGELKNLPQSFLMEVHRTFKRKNIILKGLANKEAFETFDAMGKTLVQSHIGRSLGLKIFNTNLFKGNGEMMVTKKLLFLANPKARKVIIIKEPGIVEILHNILTLLLNLIEEKPSFDLNSHLKKTYFDKN